MVFLLVTSLRQVQLRHDVQEVEEDIAPAETQDYEVNLTEEEELRRLESGAAESAPDLLCTARAILQEANGGVGTLNVFSERSEWVSPYIESDVLFDNMMRTAWQLKD